MPTINAPFGGSGGLFGPAGQAAGSIGGSVASSTYRKFVKDLFKGPIRVAAPGGGAATGTAGNINSLQTSNAWNIGYETGFIGTQTIVVPALTAAGLDVSYDNTSGDGVEILFGAPLDGTATGRLAFTSQAAPYRGFAAELTLTIEDVTGAAFAFGFRKAQALNTIANYSDYAYLGTTEAQGVNLFYNTRLNTGTAVNVDTGYDLADATQFTVGVKVDASGKATFTYGAATQYPLGSATFTFDSGDVLVPFFRYENTTDVAGTVVLNELTIGYQDQFGAVSRP